MKCPHCGEELEIEVTAPLRSRKPNWSFKRIDEMGLSTRARHCLTHLALDNLTVAGEVDGQSDMDLLRIPNFGRKSLKEVREAIEKLKGNEL